MRFLIPLIFGVVGTAILVGLGIWQLQRLEWKEAILDQIDFRLLDAPVALPLAPTEDADEYLPVKVSGQFQDRFLDVLVSTKETGPGFRAITVFQTDDGRSILVDRGFVPEVEKNDPRSTVAATVTGNLLWPDEVDSFTPAPDLGRNMWFARDLPAMADALETEPVLVVLRSSSEDNAQATPMPVDSAGISNDHLQYAVTWFGLAIIWVLMTGYFLWRQRRPAN